MVKNAKMMSMDLPKDLTTEILLRLSPESLLRFKSVCKTWYALIESANFVEKHRKFNHNITSILVTTPQNMYLKDESFYKPIIFNFPILPQSAHINILGTCNGLVCVSLSPYNSPFFICNPSTREFRLLPLPKLLDMENDLVFCGFSLFSNDYKLIRIIYLVSVIGEVIIKAEVYSMNTDSWVEIDVKMGHVNNVERLSGYGPNYAYSIIPVILNDVFYWGACSSSDSHALSFDTSEGIFDEINIPLSIVDVSIPDTEEHCWRLIEFEEQVALIVYHGEHKFKLWVLNGNRRLWTWKIKIEDISIVAGPLENSIGIIVVGYTGNGELLVEDCNGYDSKLFLYNLNSRKTKSLPSFRVLEVYNAYFYTESLLSIKLKNEVVESE